MRLKNKRALITGAGSGIGLATARAFLREGAAVLATAFQTGDREALEEVAEGLPGRLQVQQADIAVEAEAKRLVEAAVAAWGGLDILVNNAGVAASAEVTEVDDEHWERLISVNAKGVLNCSKHAVPHLLKSGSSAIVNTASINSVRGNHRLVAYSASKGAVYAMTMAMALDYAPRGLRVNCVCPATIAGTRMVDKTFDEAPDADQHERYLLAKHPMNRLGRPEEVAAAILFLASDEASFITGQALLVDGGRSIR